MEKAKKSYSKTLTVFSLMLLFIWLENSCVHPSLPAMQNVAASGPAPEIFPDYTDLTLPSNIGPIHFQIRAEGKRFRVFLESSNGDVIQMKERSGGFYISSAQWQSFLRSNQGLTYHIRIYKKEKGKWYGFAPIVNRISSDPVDPFLVYRLIPPGYETWSAMGLYQRDLTGFREYPVLENKHMEENCVNCHSFAGGSTGNMMFHIRGSLGGTMIKHGNQIEKVDLKREKTLSAGVYPSFHPSGAYIAYSTNKIEQYFHASPEKSIEVLDRRSDLIIYNIETGEVTHVPGTRGDQYMETFPNWSPDGRHLYFSRSEAQADTPFDSILYDIYRIAFNPEEAMFGDAEPVVIVSDKHQSASFPRISPDGKYLLYTVHNYGTFPIWHKEADLYLTDLSTGETSYPTEINSDESDSFHSWSSNSKWIVFSSRRYDGLHTRLYLAHMDEQGNFQKPFILPQRDPRFYDRFFYSYNVPELITGKLDVHPREWVRAALR